VANSVSPDQPPEIDASVPHSARIWNYWLGGKDNFPVDREAGDQYREAFPEIVDVARASRAFLIRAVRWLAGEAGIRQFLDIGTGLPAADNTHEVAQRVAPDARVVYVDNDPVVLAHARALLTSTMGSGSYLTLNDGTNVISQKFAQAQGPYNRSGAVPYHLRSPEQIAGFFEGLELVEPGLVSVPRWRPDPADGEPPEELDAFGAVGRKP